MFKILKSLMVVVAVAVIATGATRATWTDQQVVGNNTFATGTVDIATNPTSTLFTVSGMFPGFSETQSIVVSNTGTVNFNYDIVVSQTGGSATLYNSPYLLVKVGTTSGGGEIFGGAAGAPLSSLTGLTVLRNLTAGANETVYITVALDASAPNALQGLDTTVSFAFNASQP